ncbi:MAG TPA: ABC transporter permease [Vicinamibacterales bacterium]|nr:ABC transporter permease [Vicinamibacterales bacterium]
MSSGEATALRPSAARIYGLEARYEFLKLLRMPAYAIPTLTFPVMFYALFGVVFRSQGAGSVTMATYLLATYGAFGVIGAAFFGFGVGFAVERGQGWMLLKRATPMPPMALFVAKLFMCTIFAAAIVALLGTLAATLGGVRLPAASWLALSATLIVGSLPFCALGLALGYLVGPNAAPAIVNLVYLPMAFASGLWIPIEALPSLVKTVAPFLPAYHLGQLALRAVGAGLGAPAWTHVTALAGFTVIGLAVAVWGYWRDEDRMFG